MVRPEVAARKVSIAAARLDQAEEILSRPRDEFLAHSGDRDLASFYLFLAIQECVDLAAHWVADSGWLPPDSAGSSFDLLAEHDIIDATMASSMHHAVGLRNRIAHGYAMLDHNRIYEEGREGLADLRRFLVIVVDNACV